MFDGEKEGPEREDAANTNKEAEKWVRTTVSFLKKDIRDQVAEVGFSY